VNFFMRLEATTNRDLSQREAMRLVDQIMRLVETHGWRIIHNETRFPDPPATAKKPTSAKSRT